MQPIAYCCTLDWTIQTGYFFIEAKRLIFAFVVGKHRSMWRGEPTAVIITGIFTSIWGSITECPAQWIKIWTLTNMVLFNVLAPCNARFTHKSSSTSAFFFKGEELTNCTFSCNYFMGK